MRNLVNHRTQVLSEWFLPSEAGDVRIQVIRLHVHGLHDLSNFIIVDRVLHLRQAEYKQHCFGRPPRILALLVLPFLQLRPQPVDELLHHGWHPALQES